MYDPLGIWCNKNRVAYRKGLALVLGGRIPGAERRNARWYVPSDAQVSVGAVPPEVDRLHRLTSDLARHPLVSRLAHPSAAGPVIA
jgi:hypothetical protein